MTVFAEPIAVAQIAEEMTAIAATLRQSTVQIHGRRSAMGSGVIWQSDGWIVTNAHVVRDTAALVEFLDAEVSAGRSFQAQVMRRDRQRDLALLKINATDLPAATIGDSDRLRVGELALAMGNPLGMTGALTTGIIHVVPVKGDRWIQADIQLAPGNSGGILANAQGQVIGINSMIVNGLGFAIPSRAVQQFFQSADRPCLGVTLQSVRLRIGGQQRLGFLVLEVAIGSAAALMPLLVGDVIWGLDGQSFTRRDALSVILEDKQMGDPVQVDFLRGDRALSRSVPLQPLSPRQGAA